MSKKGQLKKEIDECEREIRAYEQKRERSQNALIRAMLAGKKAAPEDEQYFTVFSELIDKEREKLRGLYAELEALKKK
ncbi:MAG: hypothetical protein K2K13_02905 [Clostridiales bacterium]|nr:hypothetical protein [Clostridiales bacterium]MDE6028856.1 hypothetical protein [Clostridiales bacterium]MDE6617959.1 hypothetical protein [Clostridiales bacterium]